MDVVSLCPLRVSSVLWQPRRAAWAQTVVCKATYKLLPVEARLAEQQEYPVDYDNHWNDDPARSLYCPSDMVPFKAKADIMLVGHTFAPRNEPVRSLVARLLVGTIDKSIEVFCDRAWTQEGLLREGPRVAKMPLRYERAAGGPDTSNPVGMRLDIRPEVYGTVPIPNLQPVGIHVATVGDTFDPIGFGPIAPTWPTRVEKLGPYANRWSHSTWHDRPLPDDLDKSYFNSAPRDQQLDQLRDNERLILENLHPDHPRLVTSLPGVHPRAFIEQQQGAPAQSLQLTCDTLWIDTDRSLCTLVWRGTTAIEHPRQAGRIVVLMEEAGQRVGWSDAERDMHERTDAGGPVDFDPPKPNRSGQKTMPFIETGRVLEEIDEEPTGGDQEFNRPTGLPDANRSALPFANTGAEPPPRPSSQSTMGLPFSPASDAPQRATPQTSSGLPFAPSDAKKGSRPPPATASHVGLPFAPKQDSNAPRLPTSTSNTAGLPFAPAAPAEGWMRDIRTPNPPRSAHSTSAPIPPSPPSPPPAAPLPVNPAPIMPAPAPMMVSPAPMMASPAPISPSPADSPWSGGAPARSLDPLPTAAAMPQPPAASSIVATAATGSALAASNAAAAAGSWAVPSAPTPAAPVGPAAVRISPRFQPRDVVDLLWFDPKSIDRIRTQPRWKDLLASLEPKPPELKPDEDPFDDDEPPPPPPEVPKEVKDRRTVFAVLTRGDATDPEGIHESLSDAVDDDGTFIPPLVMIGGELFFPFDELETLKATVTAVTPLIAGDKKLQETVDTVNELLKTPWLQSSTGVAEGLTKKVKDVFAEGNRMLSPTYVEQHTDRTLLEQRAYQKRTVFGEQWIRSLLNPYGSSTPIPTYLPDALTKQLPMFQRFRARLIAEVHLQQDQYESHPSALRVVAIGRVHPIGMRR